VRPTGSVVKDLQKPYPHHIVGHTASDFEAKILKFVFRNELGEETLGCLQRLRPDKAAGIKRK
jgi:hypothetical protein